LARRDHHTPYTSARVETAVRTELSHAAVSAAAGNIAANVLGSSAGDPSDRSTSRAPPDADVASSAGATRSATPRHSTGARSQPVTPAASTSAAEILLTRFTSLTTLD